MDSKNLNTNTQNEELKRAYQLVYDDINSSDCSLFAGKYDAINGSDKFMYGINTVMTYIAHEGYGEDFASAAEDKFLDNMAKSKQVENNKPISFKKHVIYSCLSIIAALVIIYALFQFYYMCEVISKLGFGGLK